MRQSHVYLGKEYSRLGNKCKGPEARVFLYFGGIARRPVQLEHR